MSSPFPDPMNSGPGRFIGTVFGVVFFAAGLTILGFLWLTPFDQFGSPPLFFRIFGSFIAFAFTAMGGTLAYSAITNRLNPLANLQKAISEQAQSQGTHLQNYTCPHCAAPLQGKADVSPSGDVKCSFCNSWFNVHQKL